MSGRESLCIFYMGQRKERRVLLIWTLGRCCLFLGQQQKQSEPGPERNPIKASHLDLLKIFTLSWQLVCNFQQILQLTLITISGQRSFWLGLDLAQQMDRSYFPSEISLAPLANLKKTAFSPPISSSQESCQRPLSMRRQEEREWEETDPNHRRGPEEEATMSCKQRQQR